MATALEGLPAIGEKVHLNLQHAIVHKRDLHGGRFDMCQPQKICGPEAGERTVKKSVERRNAWAMAVCIAVISIAAGQANGQQTRSATDVKSLLEKGEKNAALSCANAVDSQRRFLKSAGTLNRFREFAEAMISLDEKVSQASDLLGSNDGSRSRMRMLFRQKILDDSTLTKKFGDRYLQLQQDLIKETIDLCLATNISEADINRTFHLRSVNEGVYDQVFDHLIAESERLAKSDWARSAAQFAASELASQAVKSGARNVGMWTAEEGSWRDFLGGLVLDWAVNAVIEEVTDPVGDVAKDLHRNFEQISSNLIDGKNGYADCCKALVQHHVQGRRKLLGLPRKEVK